MLGRAGGASCEVAPNLVTSWNDERAATLRAALAPQATTQANRAMIDKMLATIDDGKRAIEGHWRETCEARRDGTLTDGQAAARRSCLERRAFELEHKIEGIPTAANVALFERLAGVHLPDVADCATMVAPPMRDRAAVAKLFQRVVDIGLLPDAAQNAAFEALAADARMLGEREIEARALLALGVRDGWDGKLAEADAELTRAYRSAEPARRQPDGHR